LAQRLMASRLQRAPEQNRQSLKQSDHDLIRLMCDA
jgi:hypothetical protein